MKAGQTEYYWQEDSPDRIRSSKFLSNDAVYCLGNQKTSPFRNIDASRADLIANIMSSVGFERAKIGNGEFFQFIRENFIQKRISPSF